MTPAAAWWRLHAHLPQPHAQQLGCKVELEPSTRALLVVGARADEALRGCADPTTVDPHHYGRPQLLWASSHS
jgi:hypothetical protein